MRYELSLVDTIIKNHLTQDDGLNQHLEQLRVNITNFIKNICNGRSSYYISKSMVFILHHAVTLTDNEFDAWASGLTEARDILMNLRSLNKYPLCHTAIVRTQEVMGGRCVSISAELAAQAHDKFLRFSQTNQSGPQIADIEALQKNVEQTRQDFEKTSKFCATYSL